MQLSTNYQQNTPEQFAPRFVDALPTEILDKLSVSESYREYQDNPVGFAKDVLGIEVTDDIAVMLNSVRDNPITVARSATGTGKSHGAKVAALWFYKCFELVQVYTVAHPYENQKIVWNEILSTADRHSGLFDGDTIRSGNFYIGRAPKDYIASLTVPTVGTDEAKEGKFSGRHRKHMLFIVDEGDTLPDFVYRGIEGCMSGGIVVRLLILFNPRHPAGRPYRLERDKIANVIHLTAFNHPNVITGDQVIPGAVDRPTTVRRINEWCRPLQDDEKPDSECFELPGFLEGVVGVSQAGMEYPKLDSGYYKIMQPAFSYMVLGEYPAQGSNQLISREWINRARSRWDSYVAEHGEIPPAGTMGIMGQDVAEFGDDSNCACFRYGNFVESFVTWDNVDTVRTGEKASGYFKSRNLVSCNVDATGVGTGVAPQMVNSGCTAYPIKVANSPTKKTEIGEFRILRDQILWMTREWLRTDNAMLPPDEDLLEELATPTYEIKNGKICVMSRDDMKNLLKRSPDKMSALALTFADPDRMFDPLDVEDVLV